MINLSSFSKFLLLVVYSVFALSLLVSHNNKWYESPLKLFALQSKAGMSALIGLAACGISSICFGSMYVGVRKFESGDGVFVQWVVCSAIFVVGMIVYAATGFPQFQPLATLGGVLWALGNMTALPIIKIVGLGMGILIWGTVNCVVGWGTGRFGLFGINPSVPASPLLNYLGLCFVILGGILFSLVRPSVKNDQEEVEVPPTSLTQENERTSLMGESSAVGASATAPISSAYKNYRLRIIAIGLSIFAGICYGLTFVPVIYIQDNPEHFINPPDDAIYYAFSHFSGIYFTSTFVFLAYLLYSKNSPFVNPHIILPSFIAGILWAIAQLSWFLANDLLSQAITFPINAMLPGVIASLWSVFYFKEIKGARDLRLLMGAILITVIGAALVGISKTF